MSECAWTRRVCMILKKQGAEILPIVAGKRQPPGWPDRLIAHPKTGLVLIEFKDVDTRVSDVQKSILQSLWRRRCRAAIARRRPNGDMYVTVNGRHFAATAEDLLDKLKAWDWWD